MTDYTVSIPDEPVLDDLRAGRWGRAVEAFLEAVEYIVGRRREPPGDAPIPLPPLQGFHAVKLKLGTGSPWLDLELARLVGEALEGSRALVRVDANQAWAPKTAVRIIGRLERVFGDRLELVEQPVPATGPEPLQRVTGSVGVPVAADEAARSPEEIASIASKQAADIINIKLAKIGGPLQAVRGAAVAAAHGLEVMWGCMVESGYGIRHAALAALTTGFTRIVDLDSPLFLVDPPGLGEAVSYRATGRGVELLPQG